MLDLLLGSALTHKCTDNGNSLVDYELEYAVDDDSAYEAYDNEHKVHTGFDALCTVCIDLTGHRTCFDVVVFLVEFINEVVNVAVVFSVGVVDLAVCTDALAEVVVGDDDFEGICIVQVEDTLVGCDSLDCVVVLFAVDSDSELAADLQIEFIGNTLGNNTDRLVCI